MTDQEASLQVPGAGQPPIIQAQTRVHQVEGLRGGELSVGEVTAEGPSGVWYEVYGTQVEVNAFLSGLTAGATLLGGSVAIQSPTTGAPLTPSNPPPGKEGHDPELPSPSFGMRR